MAVGRALMAGRRREDLGEYRLIQLFRVWVPPVLDCLVWALSLTVSELLRYSLQTAETFDVRLLEVVLAVSVLQLTVGFATQLYRVRWRIASFEELVALAETVILVTAIAGFLNLAGRAHHIPVSALVAGAAITLVACGAVRSAWRLYRERALVPSDRAERAVVFGMGHAGMQLVNSLLLTPTSPYVPVALLDDHPAKRRLRVRNLRVMGGLPDLPDVAAAVQADVVIVSIASASGELIRRVSEIAEPAGLAVRVLPPVHELLSSSVTAESVRPITAEDLLGRREIKTQVQSIASYLAGRRVLVTGAGGSIGSELCRQIHRFAPSLLIMLDRDESALHAVQLSIEGRAPLDTRNLVVCDIRDRNSLLQVFSEHRPEVVFHAAAMKHLPLLEMWPAEAVKTNVFGTQNVIDASLAAGVTRFVNISTDKAANPASVLGYSKRIAERLTASAGERGTGTFLSVRFGNVLGSRGSVLTAFRHQIQSGGPVTVTDPAVTRFFMTVQEAVELVIQAGAVGEAGEVLILDMGEPVRIADVAKRLILECGRRVDIVYTGLRTGEKLHEELFGSGEEPVRRRHPLILHATVPSLHPGEVAYLTDVCDDQVLRKSISSLCEVEDATHLVI